MPRIDRVEGREALKPRREPYWHRLEAGCYLGFRRVATGGTWIARHRTDDGKHEYRSLGDFLDRAPSERFDAGAKAARAWFSHLDKGGTNRATTVKQACAAYVQKFRDESKEEAAKDAEARFKRWIDGTRFGGTELQKLKAPAVAAWRATLAKTKATPQDKAKEATRPRSAATLNRDMTALRAALNLALENREVTDDSAWRIALRPVKNADGRRDVYLDREQRRKLIAKASRDLAAFLTGLSLVPLRPGALAALLVGDFDKRLATLTIGKDKNGADRKITLPPSTAAFFAEHTKDKLPTAPLLARADGLAWNKDAWKYPIKEAVLAADLPVSATAYSLRHSTITDLIALHKLDTLTVTQLSGTSLAMT
jgi:integrase